MSREEAIYELKNAAWLGTDHSRARTEEAVEMAISAMLENEELSKDLDEALQEIDEYERGLFHIVDEIKNGTPIPDNATNGDVFNAIYADISRTGTVLMDDIENIIATNVNIGWWNAPYKKEGKT